MRNLLLSIVITIPFMATAQKGEKNFIDQNYIEVTGKAEMAIAPDNIYIKVLISEKDTKNKISVEALETQMFNKLPQVGINIAKDVMIKDMSSNFKSYILGDKAILLTKEYEILVHNGKQATLLFAELEKLGISNANIDRAENSQIEAFRNEVKINAIKAAKQKAKMLAEAIDQKIGAALYIKELDNQASYNRASNTISIKGYSSFNDASSSPDIDFEKIKIDYSILCVFELIRTPAN